MAIEHKAVTSSNCESCGYDEDTKEMHVKFKGGGTYVYAGVPKEKYDALMKAPSFGSHLHANIKGTYPHTKAT